MFKQKIVVEAELDININEGWIKKQEEEETRKK